MAGEGFVTDIIVPVLCCYSCPSLGEGTWRKTLTVLQSVNKKEIPGVKEQRLKIDKSKHSHLPKIMMRVYK